MKTIATAIVLALIACEAATALPAAEPAEAPAPSGRYKVPDGDAAALLKFISDLRGYQPENVAEYFEHQKLAPAAILAAAKKIVELEKADGGSEAYRLAMEIVLADRVGSLSSATATERRQVLADVKGHVELAGWSRETVSLAASTARGLESAGDKSQAAEAYASFGDSLAGHENEEFAAIGRMLQGGARRLSLAGKKMELTGETLSGERFDLASLRGKVVLVDFWATWCGPCLEEQPRMLAAYEKHHAGGLEIVAVSIDRNQAALARFVEERELPWIQLHDAAHEGRHEAVERYGIFGIPAMFLVGRDGKVISIDARGEALDALLEREFGGR